MRASVNGTSAVVRIVGLCIGAAVTYGMLHDLVTAHVCVEYFTIGHDRLIESEHPVVLALLWGVIATWYVGAVLAIPLACAARCGTAPPLLVADLVRPLVTLLAIMAVSAALAGLVGWVLAMRQGLRLPGALGDLVASDRHARFIAAWWAHAASYLVGFVGGLTLPVLVWRRRQARVAA